MATTLPPLLPSKFFICTCCKVLFILTNFALQLPSSYSSPPTIACPPRALKRARWCGLITKLRKRRCRNSAATKKHRFVGRSSSTRMHETNPADRPRHSPSNHCFKSMWVLHVPPLQQHPICRLNIMRCPIFPIFFAFLATETCIFFNFLGAFPPQTIFQHVSPSIHVVFHRDSNTTCKSHLSR